ncbi:MAG: endonuclease MutS2 [Candidatus Eisenbacteria bacterium]
MNAHALDVLEYDKVVHMLVERTSFPLGEERAAGLEPTGDAGAANDELDRVSELRALLDDGVSLSLDGARDVREALARAGTGGASLWTGALVDVASTLEVVGRAEGFLSAHEARCPRLSTLAGEFEECRELRRSILAAIDPDTLEVRDRASKELGRIRRSKARVRGRLDEKLQSILQSETSAGTVRESEIHIRNGRHVLPVRRELRGRLEGIVHDESGSGATVFVEPLATIELNNELSRLEAAEREEIERILRQLTGEVGARAQEIGRSLAALGELDFQGAKARLSRDLSAARPSLNSDGRMSVRGGRHPVLVASREGGTIVPLSVELGDEGTTLVISGPNAGGKTVALKTVGLLALMAQSGMHVPADPDTELPVFSDVYADIGDEQSIEQNLSTFSSHLSVIREIISEADENTLVLIDELGAGTDPDEGASLAIAILEALTAKRARTIATTHLGAVKSHVHDCEGMLNGSMAFDPDSLEPTFRFVPGVPGASHALSIAESMGLPESVLERARELRDSDAAVIDGLIADLSERERRLADALGKAETHEERARILAGEYEDRLKDVRDERRQIRARALAEAREILERAQSLVEDTVREIREQEARRSAIKDARQRLARERAEVEAELEAREPDSAGDGEPPSEYVTGMRVRVAGLGREGELLSAPDGRGRARVLIRGRTIEVDAGDLRSPAPAGDAGGEGPPRVTVNVTADESFVGELHLRGMTTDEVGDAIERFLSAAIVHGFSTLRIVHGKGTGALREKTHEVLKRLPAVKSFRLGKWGEGDTGVTVVELK